MKTSDLMIGIFLISAGMLIGYSIGSAAADRWRRGEIAGDVPAPVTRAMARRVKRAASKENIPVCGDYGVLEDEEITV